MKTNNLFSFSILIFFPSFSRLVNECLDEPEEEGIGAERRMAPNRCEAHLWRHSRLATCEVGASRTSDYNLGLGPHSNFSRPSDRS